MLFVGVTGLTLAGCGSTAKKVTAEGQIIRIYASLEGESLNTEVGVLKNGKAVINSAFENDNGEYLPIIKDDVRAGKIIQSRDGLDKAEIKTSGNEFSIKDLQVPDENITTLLISDIKKSSENRYTAKLNFSKKKVEAMLNSGGLSDGAKKMGRKKMTNIPAKITVVPVK